MIHQDMDGDTFTVAISEDRVRLESKHRAKVFGTFTDHTPEQALEIAEDIHACARRAIAERAEQAEKRRLAEVVRVAQALRDTFAKTLPSAAGDAWRAAAERAIELGARMPEEEG